MLALIVIIDWSFVAIVANALSILAWIAACLSRSNLSCASSALIWLIISLSFSLLLLIAFL